jgi:hypothetical protein
MKDHGLKYILDENGEPRIERSLFKWARWFEGDVKRRIVRRTPVEDYVVSTVFLGLDHSYEEGPPVLWETMVFLRDELRFKRGLFEHEQNRCAGNREQALAMHEDMVERVAAVLALNHELKATLESESGE